MAKKEGVVLDYRTARHESTEILHKRRRTAGCVEVIARVEVAILQVVVGVAMVVVGTALAYDLHLRTGVTPIFGVEIVSDELEFLDRVDAECAELGSSGRRNIARCDVVDGDVVGASARAVGVEAAKAKKRIVLCDGNDAWRKLCQGNRIAALVWQIERHLR